LLLSFVDPSLVRKHLGAQAVNAAEMVALLEQRAIPAGTPVFLDDVTMLAMRAGRRPQGNPPSARTSAGRTSRGPVG